VVLPKTASATGATPLAIGAAWFATGAARLATDARSDEAQAQRDAMTPIAGNAVHIVRTNTIHLCAIN